MQEKLLQISQYVIKHPIMTESEKCLKVFDERLHIPYANRFEEGEFRK